MENIRTVWKQYLWLSIGSTLIAVGVYFFEFLNHFTTGGVSGLSMLLSTLTPKIGAATYMLFINTLLLILGFLLIGKNFGVRTCYCSLLVSVETYLLEKCLPMTAPLTDEPMLEAVLMVVLPSLGCAILFYLDASSGGTDIVAMIIKKYTAFRISKALFFSDLLIVMLLFFVYGREEWLFSLLGFLARILLVNKLLERINTSKFCTVITPPEYRTVLCDFILRELKKGATVGENFVGAYQNRPKNVLLVALKPRQAAKLKQFAKELDANIFIIVSETGEIMGEGFYEAL